jgi:hypothetical protein
VHEGWKSGMRLFGWGVAALLVVQAVALWLRKDPLGEVVLADREWVTEAAVAVAPVEAPPVVTNPGMNPAQGPMPGRPGVVLPPAVQARVDRITQSEILGPVMRPLPMALLGIAGEDAFMRAPNGQTGLMRVGDELGGVRLLRIGTNRVLIEHERQQKELTLFSGFGGETLLPSGSTGSDVGSPVMVGH